MRRDAAHDHGQRHPVMLPGNGLGKFGPNGTRDRVVPTVRPGFPLGATRWRPVGAANAHTRPQC